MIVLTAEKISKNYSEKNLFREISFSINEGDKIGLIGINGTGKSTLLKLIAGLENPDDGKITCGKNIHIEYLPQDPVFEPGTPVIEHVLKRTLPDAKELMEYEAETILTKLGISDFQADVGILSGGQRKRVALAGVLITPADLLILDEPTNHLDLESRDALIGALREYEGTILMVAHDRYLMTEVADEVWWLKNEGIEVFLDGFPGYDRARRAFLE